MLQFKTLLALKAEFKSAAGKDWTPGLVLAPSTVSPPSSTASSTKSTSDLHDQITKQGTVVRSLKTQKAETPKVDAEVKKLLALKAEWKTLTGSDWTPNAVASVSAADRNSVEELNDRITKQGALVRDLKAQKADKTKIDAEVKTLLALKAEFKSSSGKDWAPGISVKSEPVNAKIEKLSSRGSASDLKERITKQGDLIRDLKSQKAEKARIDAEVKLLLDLKGQFKALTGSDWNPGINVANTSSPVNVSTKLCF